MKSPPRPTSLLPAILVAVVALFYGRTVTYDFVNYDDNDLVVNNGDFLGDPRNITSAFTSHLFTARNREGVYYRPTVQISYFVDYFLWGLRPAGYHLTNVIFHTLATLLLFYLAREILRQAGGAGGGAGGRAGGGPVGTDGVPGAEEAAAFLAALIFAIHPVQTESVAWVAGRNDVLLGAFTIASFACYAFSFGRAGRSSVMYAASAVLFAGALLTKETAMFFIPLYPFYDLTIRRERPVALFSARGILRMSVFPAIGLAYLAMRYQIFGAFIGAEQLYGRIPLDSRILQAPGLAMVNLLFMVWPAGLSVVHPLEHLPWGGWLLVGAGCAASAGLLALWILSARKRPVLSWSLLWLLLGLIPLLNIIPIAVPVMEHRLYAVVPGFCIAAGCLAVGSRLSPAIRRATLMAAGAACLALALVTWSRIPVWKNSETLWLDAIEKEPESSRPYRNLASYYYEAGDFDRAIPMLEKYALLKPDDVTGFTILRETYVRAGRYAEAAGVCRLLIDRTPDAAGRYIEAGLLFERLGVSDSVVAVYREGLRRVPGSAGLHERLGNWYARMGDSVNSRAELAAAESLKSAVRTSPAR